MELTEYAWWGEVPTHLVTKTQLADLDLPRQPAGPVRATIKTRNAIGRRATFDLYDVRESAPTAATGALLAAAAARRTTPRTCTECGAHPETPCIPVDGRALCATCAHIHRLRTRQREAAEAAQAAPAAAAELLAEERLAVLAVQYTPGVPTARGLPRPPAAARLTLLDRTGTTTYDRTIRLAGPRTPGAPDNAVDPAEALDAFTTARHGHSTAAYWDESDLQPLRDALRRRKLPANLLPTGYIRPYRVRPLATQWRADLDPTTGRHRTPTPPGTADRLLHLLHRIATPTRREGQP